MSDQPGPSRLQVLFQAALQDYERQTGIPLAKHPLAEQLQNCDSVESVTAVLREQTQAFSNFRGRDKVMELLKNTVSVLYKLSATADLGQAIGLVCLWELMGVRRFSDSHPIEFPACDCNTDGPCCPTLCTCPIVPTRIHL